MTPEEITNELELSKLNGKKTWFVQPTIATAGEGLDIGLQWLSENVKIAPAPAKK